MTTLPEVMHRLEQLANPDKISLKRAKFGIIATNSLGIYHSDLKTIAKQIGYNNDLAIELFNTEIYEARLLCSKLYRPESITRSLMNRWVATFENWEICDSFCMGFFAKSEYAIPKAIEWSASKKEFVKRAGFAIIASYGFADKHAENDVFEQFFPIIEREANDDRIYVRKAVNWALRNIGKRNVDLHDQAISCAHRILKINGKAAKWIAADALRQLQKTDVKILDYPRSTYRSDA